MATAVNPHQDSDAGYLQGFRIGGANSNLEFFRDADTGMLCARCHVNRHKTTDRQALVSAGGNHAGDSTAQALATVMLQGMSTAQDTPWDDPSSGDDQRQRPDCVVVLLVQLVSRTIGLATSVPAGGFPCNGVPAGRAPTPWGSSFGAFLPVCIVIQLRFAHPRRAQIGGSEA